MVLLLFFGTKFKENSLIYRKQLIATRGRVSLETLLHGTCRNKGACQCLNSPAHLAKILLFSGKNDKKFVKILFLNKTLMHFHMSEMARYYNLHFTGFFVPIVIFYNLIPTVGQITGTQNTNKMFLTNRTTKTTPR